MVLGRPRANQEKSWRTLLRHSELGCADEEREDLVDSSLIRFFELVQDEVDDEPDQRVVIFNTGSGIKYLDCYDAS